MALSAEDKLAIQELNARYALAMDNADVESWMRNWIEDGVWRGKSGTYKGTVQLRRLLPDIAKRIKNKRHVMTNFIIEGDIDWANQHCYMMIVDITRQMPPLTCVYTDRLEKHDGKWLYAERIVALDEPPLDGAAAPPEGNSSSIIP